MKSTVSDRCLSIAPSATLAVSARADAMKKAGIDVIDLSVGEPDFATPAPICTAAKQALDMGLTRYTPAAGSAELRRAVCRKLLRENGLAYEPEDVVICSGAKHALYNVCAALINPGDEVLLPAPYWVSYGEMIRLCGGVPVIIDGRAKDDFIVSAEAMRRFVTPRTKAILINSPGNPGGGVMGRDGLAGIARLAEEKDLTILSDEIYEKLIYDGARHISIASLSADAKSRTVVVNGVSKSHAMTGWRIGYAAGPRDVMRAVAAFQSHTCGAPNTMAQHAAITALDAGDTDTRTMRDAFDARRRAMWEGINAIPGLSCRMPGGAFYMMVNVEALLGRGVGSPADFAAQLLERAHVAVVPGEAFGDEKHVRISFAVDIGRIREATDRISRFVGALC